jgi:glycosyltransferase involved in cell wall biosynthesis
VTIIVCCHNSSKRLAPTLASLSVQQISRRLDWEVIVVDNASTDGTAQTAISLWPPAAAAPMRVITERRPGLSNARDTGLRNATFEYVSFIDDDNWVCSDWVETVAAVFDNRPDVGLCGGSGEPVFETKAPCWFASHAVNYAVGPQAAAHGYLEKGYLWGAGLSIRHSAWRDLVAMGFRVKLTDRCGKSLASGGDTEICLALVIAGWKQWFESGLTYRHFIPANRLDWQYLRRLYRAFGVASVALEPYIFVQARTTSPEPPTGVASDSQTLMDRIRCLWAWRLQAAVRDLLRRRRKIPKAIWSKIAEGDADVLHIESAFGRLCHLLLHPRAYGEDVRAVRQAHWRNPGLSPSAEKIPEARVESVAAGSAGSRESTRVRIAVLITYHNEGAFLTECLDSLRSGRTQPDEILVYDDASKVSPESFIPSDLPVRVIRGSENLGPAHGRNVLLEACGCNYIHFHDADDLFEQDWCDQVRSRLEAEDLDAVFTESVSFQNEAQTETGRTDLTELAAMPDLVRYCLSHSLLPACGTYRRERVLGIGGYSEKYWQSEDYDFHIRLAASGPRFGVILRPLVRQRLHDRNRSGDRRRVWADGVRILETLSLELDPEYRPDVCDALVRAGRTLYGLGAIPEARNAFAKANRIGDPRYPGESAAYRFVACGCGPIFAERVGLAYRALLPDRIRARRRA